MVKINSKHKAGHTYICLYQGNKFLKNLGREDKISPEKILYEKRKAEKELKKIKDEKTNKKRNN